MPHRYTPTVLPSRFPIEDVPDWTEISARTLVLIGVAYFAGHFLVDGLRGLFS